MKKEQRSSADSPSVGRTLKNIPANNFYAMRNVRSRSSTGRLIVILEEVSSGA